MPSTAFNQFISDNTSKIRDLKTLMQNQQEMMIGERTLYDLPVLRYNPYVKAAAKAEIAINDLNFLINMLQNYNSYLSINVLKQAMKALQECMSIFQVVKEINPEFDTEYPDFRDFYSEVLERVVSGE